jgi:formylglycine-generating enzyme required for sulfatase activity
VLTLGGRILDRDPNYRDVPQLMAEARRRTQAQPPVRRSDSGLPKWLWGVGVGLLVLACLVGLGLREFGRLFSLVSTPTSTSLAEVVETVTVAVSTETPNATPNVTDTPVPSTRAGGDTRIREADGMAMVSVPAGTFQMGSAADNPAAQDDEKPQHQVTLDAFWIDRTEVANAQYNRCVEANICQRSRWADLSDYNGADYPVVGISWNDAATYCQWAGGRLPTEAEWEYAARGPEGRIYPWGNEFDPTKANISGKDDGFEKAAPVGSYPAGASWVRALDLAGNVWEWVQSEYRAYPYKADDGREKPNSTNVRVLRGGSWYFYGIGARAAYRTGNTPDTQYGDFGFRCAAGPP